MALTEMDTSRNPAMSRFLNVGKWKRHFLITGVLIVAATLTSVAVIQYNMFIAARLREGTAVAAVRSLGGEIEDQPVAPFGPLLAGIGAGGYRFAIKLRNPAVTDDQLAALDDLGADRVASLDLLNCAIGDATLVPTGRFDRLTLLGLGQARNSKAEPWPSGPAGLLTETGFVHLARLPELETVGLHGPDVTDRCDCSSVQSPQAPRLDSVWHQGNRIWTCVPRAQARFDDAKTRRNAIRGRRPHRTAG